MWWSASTASACSYLTGRGWKLLTTIWVTPSPCPTKIQSR